MTLKEAFEACERAGLVEEVSIFKAREKMHGQALSHQSNLIEELDVQCKFWRQAAEHAVKGWNALEDKVEASREVLRAIEHNVDAAHELLGSTDEWAPPESVVVNESTITMSDGTVLHAIEDEVAFDDKTLPFDDNKTTRFKVK